MRVPVKLLGFSFWLFFLNCAQCQECLREDIEYENTELAPKPSYADGETVKVTCVTGYIGSYKLKCQKGKWRKTVGRSCMKKKCPHPGDTPNGDFKLTEGAEFVFGATVVYTCNKGYEMTSRINRRTCRAQGWDNAVPVCEEVTCNLKSTLYGIIKINPQGRNIFRAGESVEITCSEKHWIFFTKETDKTFTCKDNGEWDHKPVCEDIRCEVPHFQHVRSPDYYFRGDKKLGTKHYYYCESGYEKMAEEATCTQDGWTPNPLCEIMCAAPNIPNAEFVEFQRYRKYRINSILEYKCHPGFEPEEPVQITCNNHKQWTGIQQCTEMCAAPNIPNAEIVGDEKSNYKINSILEYKCRPGFEPEELVQITCNSHRQWTGIRQCTEMCAAPNIPNAEIVGDEKSNYKINSILEYKCRPGFEPEELVQITCDSQAQWTDIQQCTKLTCQFESITSGVKRIIPEGQTVFKVGESVEIICTEKNLFYTKETSKSFTCQRNGKWDSKPGCEITCEVPHDQHASSLEYYFSGETKLGAKRFYGCKSGYHKTAEEATCTRDGWTPKPLCAEIMCDPPRVPNAEIVGGQRINYKTGSRIEYKCNPGFEPGEPVHITCDSQGQWTGIQQCTDGTCQEQELKNIQIIFGYPSPTSPYKPGHILVFRCTDDNMRFYGQHSIKCQPDGRWNYPYPQCGGMVQCSKPTKNLPFVTLSDEKTEYSNSETLTYTCNKPYNESTGGVLMCQNGNWNGTYDCRSKICPPPPYLQHGDYSIESTTDKVITAVSYTCQSYYVLTKQQDIYKCVDGKWETPPKCLRPCEIDDIVEKYNLQIPTGKVYIRHAEKYKLNCRDGWHTGSKMKAYVEVLCSDGSLQIDTSCDAQNNSK